MKSILRSIITNTAGLFLTSWIVPGFHISRDLFSFTIAAGCLILANWFVKPILKIIFLPVNIATFGLFAIVINAIILFGVSHFVGGISVTEWTFNGYEYYGYTIPKITFGIIGTYLVSGLIIGSVTTLMKWLAEE